MLNRILILYFSLLLDQDYNFNGFLTLAKFDTKITVAMNKKELSDIDFFQFNDCIDNYAKKKFNKKCNEVVVIKCNGKKYFVCAILDKNAKELFKLSREDLTLTLQKTKECGRLTIYLTGIRNSY